MTGPDPLLRLELGDSLVVVVAGGVLVAAHADNETDRWIVRGPDVASLLSLLPPLPVPQLGLVLGRGPWDEPTPYTGGVVWQSAEWSEQPGPAPSRRIVLRGRGRHGEASAAFDAHTVSLRSFDADLASGYRLEIVSEPVQPGDPESWALPVEGRTIVAGLSDLRPQRGPIAPGRFVPNIALSPRTGPAWELHAALAALPAPSPGGPTPAVALILFRVPDDPVHLARSESAARLALDAARLAAAEVTLDTRLVAAVGLAGAAERLAALDQRWGTDPGRGPVPYWQTPSASIDLFSADALAVLALVAPDRRLLAVIPLDDRTDARALAADISAAIRTPR